MLRHFSKSVLRNRLLLAYRNLTLASMSDSSDMSLPFARSVYLHVVVKLHSS